MEKQILKKILEINILKLLEEHDYLDIENLVEYLEQFDFDNEQRHIALEFIYQSKLYNILTLENETKVIFGKTSKELNNFLEWSNIDFTDYIKNQYITCDFETMPLKYFMESEK